MQNPPWQQSNRQNNSRKSKYWGIWLPVTTFFGIINSIFWIWLLSRTGSLPQQPMTDTEENRIIELF